MIIDVDSLSLEEIELFEAEALNLQQSELAETHPAFLLMHVKCVDEKTGDTFEFNLLDQAERDLLGLGPWFEDWFWQRELLEEWLHEKLHVSLKGRQIGVTWLACGLALWHLLYKPGTTVLAFSINQDEASKLINRIWDMYLSLPAHLRNGVEVLKPARDRPSTEIEVRHPDGRISMVDGMASTAKAGHSRTAALVIMDEMSRQDYARETWKAVIGTMIDGGIEGGKIIAISTANGVSNEETGEGNYFHYTYVNADHLGVRRKFLKWDLHPDRDEEWYESVALPPRDKAEQFPNDDVEAFLLSGSPYFDVEALAHYRLGAVAQPLYRGQFTETEHESGRARFGKRRDGYIRVYQEPDRDCKYAIYADCATMRGHDYSCAYVIDLSDMTLCAQLHLKQSEDDYALQLHYLGRWFNDALIAVESTGGYGNAIIIFLRDGRRGRPPYPKLYRHRMETRSDSQQMAPWGFPLSSKTRPLVVQGMERALREHALPAMDMDALQECATFVTRDTGTSPAATNGCNDDRVIAIAGCIELFRQYGEHPNRRKSRRKTTKPRSQTHSRFKE